MSNSQIPFIHRSTSPNSKTALEGAVSSGSEARVSHSPQVVYIPSLDWLEVNMHVEIPDRFYNRALSAKHLAQTGELSEIPFFLDDEEYYPWNVSRMGTRYYSIVLSSGDIKIFLSSRTHESHIPNCKVEYGSLSSQKGAFEHHRDIKAILQLMGFRIHKETIARIDLCADFLNIAISDLNIEKPDNWISRARKFSVYYDSGRLTGCMLGSGSILMRAYDKSDETKKNQIKSDYFHEEKWKCPEGTKVTRIEFQIRREALKSFLIPVETPQQIEGNLDTLWKYLSQDWARLADCPVDKKNKNQGRASISQFWQTVQSVTYLLPVPSFKNRRIKKQLHKNLISLREQARGCLLNLAAAAGHDVDDFFGIIGTCIDAMSTDLAEYMSHHSEKFKRKFTTRRNECFVGM